MIRKTWLGQKVWIEIAQTYEQQPVWYFSFGFFGLVAHFDKHHRYVLWSNREADAIAWVTSQIKEAV